VPHLSVSAVVIQYEEALYQVYALYLYLYTWVRVGLHVWARLQKRECMQDVKRLI